MSQQHEWITVGALADGFAAESFVPNNVTDLADKNVTLYSTQGKAVSYVFNTTQLTCKEAHQTYTADYRATLIREHVYFIDYLYKNLSYSIVLDLNNNSYTHIQGQLPNQQDCSEHLYHLALANKELTLVTIAIQQGSINKPYTPSTPIHNETDELIGIRNLYRYSPNETYEHIYLNQNFYTWQCLTGVEAGLADTDRCHYYKIAEHLYLFIWREKIIPTLGIVLIDLTAHRSYGKICGYATGDFTSLANFPVSSYCSLINTTTYD